ncbi:MAG: Ig-like domain-containing protein [Deltaproteobacteria bacterium]|nr:Ig-like domain-containing protein [Deltaproteobacteria bacterium]
MCWLGLFALVPGLAYGQVGPGLGNLAYDPSEVMKPIGFIESPHGHGNVAMVQGYLMAIYSSDGGGSTTDGGIEFWDVSDPTRPVRVVQRDDAATHGLREAHGFSLAWYDDRLLLAAQGIVGVQIWDVTDPQAIEQLSYVPLPGIGEGDYSGDWWLFWQAPYVYVAGVDEGLYVLDASDPRAPALAARVQTGELGGVSPAQTFALGNLLVVAESQGRGLASLDISIPDQPRLLQQVSGSSGYSHLFGGPGLVMTSGNVPPRATFFDVSPAGAFSRRASVGFYLNSGGYGSYQDGYFHSGFSDRYVKFRVEPPEVSGEASSGRADRDEDFATVLGNLVVAGNDHGTGTAIYPHQAQPDTAPPIVEWMHPPSGATNVALTSRVGLSFSDHIDAGSLGPTTVWLEDSSGAVIPTKRSAQLGLVNLAPEVELPLNATIKIVASGVLDVAGNPSPRFEGTFTTGDGSTAMSPTAVVRNVDVNIAIGEYALGVFGAGKRVYSDREYEFTTSHSPRFDRQAYIQTANSDKINFLSRFLTFDLLRPAEVLVLFDARASSRPSWMSGFVDTQETVGSTDTSYRVYSQRFSAGSVTLGGNSASGSSGAASMYSVVIIPDPVPCQVDLSAVETGTVTLAGTGPAGGTMVWTISGRSYSGPAPRVYLPPGRHSVRLEVTDGEVSASCGGVKISHEPLLARPARVATKLVLRDGHTFNVNPDHGSVSDLDVLGGTRVWESSVGGRPTSLSFSASGELWVLDRSGAVISVLDPSDGAIVRRIQLPRASSPVSLVFDAAGTCFVSLSALGKVIALSPDGRILREAVELPSAHGLTWLEGRLFVTRFISPPERGLVWELSADTLSLARVISLELDPGPDTEASGRGVPNYVSEFQVSPSGRTGYVSSKKDNVLRGVFRENRPLSFESRVRAIVSSVELSSGRDLLEERLDVNDRELVLTTLPSPLGDLLFVVSQGANMVDVFDTATFERVSQFEVGLAPDAIALDPTTGTLAVHGFLSRSVSFFDVFALLSGTGNAVTPKGVVTTVSREVLDPAVLQGKKIFHNSADPRMSRDKYLSCASCHLEGGQDGRVWDFTQAGEGLRNTIALTGRAGTRHGRVHWTANFDEIQDFENDIRGAFGGRGFLTDADFSVTQDPLGVPKAGRSAELDALAVYVASLDRVPPSPHRAADGSLTAAARRGREVFVRAECGTCHAHAEFTDQRRHDVGTVRASSGLGIGAPLPGVGFDTPTLLGVFETTPYLHDGSAATLYEVLDRHGEVPALSTAERADLVSYMLELDSTSLAPELPCDSGPNECVEAAAQDAGVSAPDGGVGASDAAALGGPDGGASDGAAQVEAPVAAEGCGCAAAPTQTSGERGMGLPWFLLVIAALRCRWVRPSHHTTIRS